LPLIVRATEAQLPSFSKLHQPHHPPVAKDSTDVVGHSKGHIGCLWTKEGASTAKDLEIPVDDCNRANTLAQSVVNRFSIDQGDIANSHWPRCSSKVCNRQSTLVAAYLE
jgi:hypothetical protein